MKLFFDQSRIPRTTTRRGWRVIDRWRRVTERKLCAHEETLRTQVAAFGSVVIAEQLINPPVCRYP